MNNKVANPEHDPRSDILYNPIPYGSVDNSQLPKLSDTTAIKSKRISSEIDRRVDSSLITDDTNITSSGTATISNETFNLIKNLVGAGALGLPSGVASFAGATTALIPSTIIIFIFAGVFGYYFHLLGRICGVTNTRTYRDAWDATVGRRYGWIPALFTTLMAGLGNLAYSMILADTVQGLLAWSGLGDATRNESLVGVTVLVLLPLCMIKEIQRLAPFSLMGLAGILFTVVAIIVRYFDGTYYGDGKYLEGLPDHLKPSFNTVGAKGAFSFNVLVLVCMTFQAYFAHYNAPRYHIELKNNTVKRFAAVVIPSFGVSAVIYTLITVFGFLTFGLNCDGFILNNYSTDDALMSICRFAIAFALALTYPLPFIGTRDGILDLFSVPDCKRTASNINILSVLLLALFTLMASYFKNLGMVNAVGGGLLGTAVVFVFPALMYQGVVTEHLGIESTKEQRHEVIFAIVLMWMGIIMGAIGVLVSLSL